MSLHLSRGTRVFVLLLAAGALSGALFGLHGRTPGLLDELTRETRRHGVPGMRVSIVSGFRACAFTARTDTVEAVCGVVDGVPSRRTLAVIRSATEAARAGADPRALHAAALALMLFPSSGGIHLDQSISYLQSASRLSEQPAPVLADLAAAHLMRARQAGSRRDLFEALEAADRALELEPRNQTARFNAAAALDRIGTPGQTADAWSAYLAVDSTSGWAREARRRRALLPAPRPRLVPPRTRAQLEAYVAASPADARELGWNDLLREWGAAVLANDTAAALLRLEQAEVLGAALVRRGGDATLADAAATIRRYRRDAAMLARLARAHVELGAGRKELLDTRYKPGCPRVRRALDEGLPGPLREWARTFAGLCAMHARRAGTIGELADMAAATDSTRYPALAGRRRLILATALHGTWHYDAAVAEYRQAGSLLDRAGEREHAATARMQVGTVQSELGQAEAGYATLHEALAVLREYPGCLGLYNGLYALRNALLADGLPRAAMRVQNEAVAVAGRMKPTFQAETRLARARLRLAVGGRGGDDDVETDVGEAVEIMKTLDEEFLQGWMVADLRQTRAEAWVRVNPARAATELDSVVSFFAANPARQLPALFARAQVRLALGQPDAARADLERVAVVLDGQRTQVSSAQLRASLLDQSRQVFDQAVMLSVRAGQVEEALDYVERSRASFSPVGRAPGWARRPLRTARGEIAVEFALVGDTLLAWTLWNGGLHLSILPVRRAQLARTVERVQSGLELRSPDRVVLPALDSLYDELIRPLRPHLGAAGTPLVIVADGELAALPMAALRDRQRGRYLVQDHPVRFASSLRDPVGTGGPPDAGMAVTLVADPAFDRLAFPELQRLEGAGEEVRALARRYPGARVLPGAVADAAALREAFRRGGIAHFAGHAVFDDARPERSFLVSATDRVTAAEIEGMDLQGLRLVVLSACQTARAQAGRSGGFAGLAGAFLAAGAGGVVGSLWRVDDQATRTLMEHFHAAYATSGNAADALRQAQLQMLRSDDPMLRSPAAWAGFRYAGG
jgi:CHAT domain-containing protein